MGQEKNGFCVLRGYLSEEEVVAMETPLLRQQAAPSSPTQGEGTRLNFPDHSHLKADPSIAVASFGNPVRLRSSSPPVSVGIFVPLEK